MTIDLEAIRKRWVDTGYGSDHPDYGLSAAERMDRRAAYAIQDIPDLLAEVERLRALLQECDAERMELQGRVDGKCEWIIEAGMFGDPYYVGDCGIAFVFDDGGVVENGVKFCPQCGRRVVDMNALERLVPDIEDSKR